MNRYHLKVPSQSRYLSDWSTFDSTLPTGKVIVSKGICGCGATEYYLTNNQKVVDATPRKEQIHSKMQSNYRRKRKLHYYDRSNSNVSVQQSKNLLVD